MNSLPFGSVVAFDARALLDMQTNKGVDCSECVDTKTRILTQVGWKGCDQICAGDLVYTLNHESGVGEWQPLIAARIFPASPRHMILMNGRAHSSLTMPDHKWPVRNRSYSQWGRRWKSTAQLNTTDFVQCAAVDNGLPSKTQWSDAFVELVAWIWTEGCWGQSKGLTIVQSQRVNAENCDRIRAALTDLFGPRHLGSMYPHRYENKPLWIEDASKLVKVGAIDWRLNQAAAASFIGIVSAPVKVVSLPWLQSLSLRQLELFIDVSMRADGHIPRQRLTQKSREAAEAFAFACILAGKAVSIYDVRTALHHNTEVGMLKRVQFSPVAHMRNSDRAFAIKCVKHSGRVWCPVTSNKTWLARRDRAVYWL